MIAAYVIATLVYAMVTCIARGHGMKDPASARPYVVQAPRAAAPDTTLKDGGAE